MPSSRISHETKYSRMEQVKFVKDRNFRHKYLLQILPQVTMMHTDYFVTLEIPSGFLILVTLK